MNFYHFADLEGDTPRLYIEGEIAPSEPWWDSLMDAMGANPGDFVTPPKFRDALKTCAGKPLTVVVDSPGGDYAAGLAIYEALRAYSGPVTVHIYRAYSAATLIALGGDKRLISDGGSIMIHSPACAIDGKWQDMRSGMAFLLALRDSAAAIYARHLDMTQEEAAAMMDAEMYWSSRDAIAAGWAAGPIGPEEKISTMRQTMRATMLAYDSTIRAAMQRADEDKERADILRLLRDK